MIMLQELVSSELEVKVHLLPETSSFSSLAVHLVRHERRAAQPVDQSEVVVGQVSLVGRHFLDGKFSAVFSTSGLKNGLSPASRSPISTAVTMFVLTPQMACALTQSWPERSQPYFSSYHLTNREVEKPDESGAKLVSNMLSGRLLWTIRFLRTGVSMSFSRKEQTDTLFIRWDK